MMSEELDKQTDVIDDDNGNETQTEDVIDNDNEKEAQTETTADETSRDEDENQNSEPQRKKKKSRAQRRIEQLAREKRELLRKIRELEEGEPIEDPEVDFKVARDILEAKFDEVRDKYEDFDYAISRPDIPFTTDLIIALSDTDNAGEIAYYLAKHPEKAEEISKLSPRRMAVALGKLDAKIENAPVERQKTKPKKDIPSKTKTTVTQPTPEQKYMEQLDKEVNPFWDT